MRRRERRRGAKGTGQAAPEGPIGGAGSRAHLLTSLNSEEGGGGDRKSEAPIRAMNSGNAEGGWYSPRAHHEFVLHIRRLRLNCRDLLIFVTQHSVRFP
jgi:hypothetical protein